MPKLNKKQAKQVADAEGGELLVDAGVYAAILNKVEEKTGQAGPYWEWEFQLVEDSDGNELEAKPKVWENTSLSEKAAWRLRDMFEAFEVGTDTDTDDLLGQWVALTVGQEIAKQGSRQGQLRNIFLSAAPITDDGDEDDESEEEDE